ncbi:MAG: ROK family protein [Deltaproteobacteria bacterium]|nr:ROK family protein [Deltaproteobacteria bacterium]
MGIDIGGTGIKASVVDMQSGALTGNHLMLPTPQPSTPKAILATIRDIISDLNWRGKVGSGFPGVIKKGTIFTAANLSKEWIGVNLENEIHKFTERNVAVINDADAAGLAEMKFGAGAEYNKDDGGVVLLVTLGTGIGTALFVDGDLVRNTEFGHIEIDGVDAETRAATVHREREGLSWEDWGARVNKYLQTMEKLLSPDVFIIGGGVSESSEKFFPFIKVRAKMVPAQMGNDAGIVGAALAIETQYVKR